MKDYYTILGVSSTASQDEIKRAYRKLAVKYHPDKNPAPEAEQLFKEMTAAYDVIGDPQKRQAYDQKRNNVFAEIFNEPVTPKHRDPAYKRHRPVRPPSGKQYSDAYYLMKSYLKYFQWLCWLGLIVTSLFFIDYVLPYKTTEEKTVDMYDVRGTRNTIMYFVALTETGKKIKLYSDILPFAEGKSIILKTTRIYHTPMQASNLEQTLRIRLDYMYQYLILFPVILFITSIVGVVFKKRIELCFNVSIVSGIFLIIFWYLI